MEFLVDLGVPPQVVTIHPDRPQWRRLYEHYCVEVRLDPECVWTDGSIGGYCTEFYREGVEIGNIVNPLGTGLDCGFGGERIQRLLTPGLPTPSRGQVIYRTIGVLLESGIQPSNVRQGYVLRRLIREQLRRDDPLPDHRWVDQERLRRQQLLGKMPALLRKHPAQSLQWFWETHGIHPEDWEGGC